LLAADTPISCPAKNTKKTRGAETLHHWTAKLNIPALCTFKLEHINVCAITSQSRSDCHRHTKLQSRQAPSTVYDTSRSCPEPVNTGIASGVSKLGED